MRHTSRILVLAGASTLVGCGSGDIGFAPLARDQLGVTSMTADENYLYWTLQSGALRRVSIDGGDVETVVENITNPDNVVVDGSHAYWTMNEGVVARAPKAGGAVEQLAENEQDPVGLRVDGTDAYWARRDGVVRRAPKAGGEQLTLVDGEGQISALALAGTSLLWIRALDATDGAVREAPTTGGDAQTLVVAPGTQRLAASGADVCWASFDPDALALDPKSHVMRISRAARDGTEERVVVTDVEDVDALVVDDTQIYFSTLAGDVHMVALAGGAPTNFASGPEGKTSIALDTTSVYWAHSNSDAIFVYPKAQAVVYE